MRITAIIAICVVVGCVAVAYLNMAFSLQSAPKENEPPPQKTAQKFRFYEQCPDGTKVDYINTFRLPKSVVCQKPVGEE